jgi:hypothetical protein
LVRTVIMLIFVDHRRFRAGVATVHCCVIARTL